MKLSRVTLDFDYKVPGSAMEQPQASISEDDASTVPGKPGEMRYDAATNSLVFGDNDYGINWSRVIHWERANLELECPTCQKPFDNGHALAGHRRHCKQKEE